MSRPAWRRIGVFLAGLFVLTIGLSAYSALHARPAHAAGLEAFIVYGDSLTCEEKPHLEQRLRSMLPYTNIQVRCQGGTAQCDWHGQMEYDAANLNPQGVMLAFSGNYLTPCITSRDYRQGYIDDIGWVTRFWRDRSVPLMFVATMGPPGTTAQDNSIPNIYAYIGAVDGTLTVRNEKFFADSSDRYQLMMPCLNGECTDTIQVRTSASNGHLCINGDCSLYSSGVVRYAENEVHGVASLKGLGQPAYRYMVTPTAPGPPVNVSQTGASTTAATVNFAPPSGTVRGYQYSLNNGATWCGFAGAPLNVTGLTDGACTSAALAANSSYTVKLRAFNNVGPGPAATVNVTTTATAPSFLSRADATSTSVTVAFTAPAGSATITNYQYSTDSGTNWCPLSPADAAAPVVIATVSNASCTGGALASNTTYPVRLKALNAGGSGSPSTAVNAITTAPAPAGLTQTSADTASGTVAFTQPTGGGALPVTGYQYSTDNGTSWCTLATTTSPATVSAVSDAGCTGGALSANSAYAVKLRAATTAGIGASSGATTVTTVSGAPTALTQTGSSGSSVTVALTAPSGNAAVTNYQYSTDDGATFCPLSPADGQSPVTITTESAVGCGGTALSANTTYPIQLKAVNAAGVGAASTAVTTATGTGPPGTVTQTDATSASVTLSFTEPAGPTIDAYQYSTDGGTTWCALGTTTSPATVSAVSDAGCTGGALASNTTYPMRLRAVTGGLTGTAALASITTVSGAPTALTQTGSSGSSVTVALTAPSGNAAVTNYQYSTDGGTTFCPLSPADGQSPVTITTESAVGCGGAALSENTTYPIQLKAVNAAGVGAASASADVDTQAGAPTSLSRQDATGASLTVAFDDPTGTTIVNHQYSTDNGTTWCALNPVDAVSPVIITTVSNPGCTGAALAPNTTYAVKLKAVNRGGAGVPSAALSAATNTGAPTGLAQTGSTATSATVSFTAPAGATVSNYQYSTDDGSTWCAVDPVDVISPIIITASSDLGCTGAALSENTALALRLRAVTATGTGTPSTKLSAATLAGPATALTQIAATTTTLTVAFTPPAGTATPTNYQYSTDNGTTWCPLSPADGQSPVTVTRVSNAKCSGAALASRTSYAVRVKAVTAAGAGTASAAFTASTSPAAPTALSATTTSAAATISFTAPTGTTTITNYQYSTDNGTTWCLLSPTDGVSPVTITTVSAAGCGGGPLGGNTAYAIRLKAVTGLNPWNVSAASAAITATTRPAGPGGLLGTAGVGAVTLSWAAPTGGGALVVDDYVIQYSKDNSTWSTYRDGISTTMTTTVGKLTAGVTYYFRVAAKTSAGQGAWTVTYPVGYAPL